MSILPHALFAVPGERAGGIRTKGVALERHANLSRKSLSCHNWIV
jgi:hypothetical protein